MQTKYHEIEVGLSGTGYPTSNFNQPIFLGSESIAIVRTIILGLIANESNNSYIKVKGKNGTFEYSCSSTSNTPIDDIELPEPYDNTPNEDKENDIVENDIISDPSCSYWLKEQLLNERDPIDMLNDIDTLSAVLKNRINKENL